ncbi:hypothetical protein M0R45_018107 [Rubus argutus]|uniref:SH3 domain-containing protein n=1 Tax=Rubus argutus TaxID=59490 RepID=A0AAW1X1K5_RUBAR
MIISRLLPVRLMNFLPVLELMLLMLMRKTSSLGRQLVTMICGQKPFWRLQNWRKRMLVHGQRGLEEADIAIHLWGGPSFNEGLGSPIREEPPPYSSPAMQRFESFENPLALYDFTAGGDDELNLTAGEEVDIEYEVDGWFYVKKKRPGRDGKMAGLVPVLYVSQS